MIKKIITVIAFAIFTTAVFAIDLETIKTKAEKGDIQAQYSLGLMYLNGDSVQQDSKQAIYWLEKSADAGDKYAQYELGKMYHTGQGVPKSKARAIYWLWKADEQAYIPAFSLLNQIQRQ